MPSNQERKRKFRSLSKKGRGEWKDISERISQEKNPGMTRAFSNNLYIVMIFDSTETNEGIIAQKAMVQQVDAKPIKNHWREMNRIKNELFGEEKTAIEYYPAKSRLIDEHDIYWLWIFEEGVLPTYN